MTPTHQPGGKLLRLKAVHDVVLYQKRLNSIPESKPTLYLEKKKTLIEGAAKKEFEPTFVKPDSIKLKMMSTKVEKQNHVEWKKGAHRNTYGIRVN